MSVARGLGQNGGHYYSNITQPVEIDLNFIVDSTNGNGMGVRSIKSNGYVENVFMHTSASPGTGLGGKVNPNPAAGYALIQFKNNFNVYLGGYSGVLPPLASTGVTSTTSGNPYVIVTLGTTTLTQWNAAGLPAGLIPTVGQSFIAIRTGALGGTGTMGIPGASNIISISVVGDPNLSISNSNLAANAGAYLLVQFVGPTSSGSTVPLAQSPTDGSVVALTFKFDRSSVSIPDRSPANSSTTGGL